MLIYETCSPSRMQAQTAPSGLLQSLLLSAVRLVASLVLRLRLVRARMWIRWMRALRKRGSGLRISSCKVLLLLLLIFWRKRGVIDKWMVNRRIVWIWSLYDYCASMSGNRGGAEEEEDYVVYFQGLAPVSQSIPRNHKPLFFFLKKKNPKFL